MQPTVSLFRECWGTRRPAQKNITQRAKKMGYDHLQLHKVAGNWWLSLAAEPCCDFVLALSVAIADEGSYAIIAQHIDGPVFIVWTDGRLEKIQQQPVAVLNTELSRLPEQTVYFKSGHLPQLPACWNSATELMVDCSASQLLPLSKVRQLAAYKGSRQKQLVGLLLLPLALFTGYLYWQSQDLVEPAPSLSPVATTSNLRLLEPAAALLVFARYAERSLRGAWRLKKVKLQSSTGSHATARATYQGQPPLAWYQLADDYSMADSNSLLIQHSERLSLLELSAVSSASVRQSVSALHRQLILNPQSGISVHQQGKLLQLSWREVSRVQLLALAEQLKDWLVTVEQGYLEPSELGWNGSLTLAPAPGQPIVATDKDRHNET